MIDPDALPKHFDSKAAEARWDDLWAKRGIYRYDSSRPREQTFVVDTPPPTVSGALHIGHVFSYTHTDVLVRNMRMRNKNIFYPMGWDDNGLPTERRVQNYFHVRCDPHQPYKKGMELAQASARQRKRAPQLVSRSNFIELCHRLTAEDEKAFMELWRRLALSVDWSLEYATIDDRSRRLAQLSFLDLHEKGHVYNVDAPTIWDVDFQTAVAQAELEAREIDGAFHHLRFGVQHEELDFVIATTRPELLPACVGVAAHPDDSRYRHLFGKRAVTPLFRIAVPIFPSELVDPDKGTGIVMVCTFGDQTDVLWWREQQLALRVIMGRDGRLLPIDYGSKGWESIDPAAANRYYAHLAGQTGKAARAHIVELLRDRDGAATAAASRHGAPLAGDPRALRHTANFFEKGDRPVEVIRTRQWFVRLLDKKQELLDAGRRIRWHPSFMGQRYADWTSNLSLDWCISRQRHFGVPFPLWYRCNDQGLPDFGDPMLAERDRLPVDPMASAPTGYTESQRGRPGGFIAETDVFDTWFTSSMTPQIATGWLDDPAAHRRLFPGNIRPQSHEIIRTWAFYTIAKGLLHQNTIPWTDVLVSGWVLDPDRKKMSKSRGNVLTPLHLLDQYTADGVRYWAASARLGADTAFDEKQLKVGKRLVTKLFNAGKFVLSQSAEAGDVSEELDLSFVRDLASTVERATNAFEDFECARALAAVEGFFWSSFTDAYIELVKERARADGQTLAPQRTSAVATLRLGLNVILRLFAPTLPYVTEEVWSWAFARQTGIPSIHVAPWPEAKDFDHVPPPANAGSFSTAAAALGAINRAKTNARVSLARPATRITLECNEATKRRLDGVVTDVKLAAKARELRIRTSESLPDNAFEVPVSEFAEHAPVNNQ